jgi:hypothetical protein
MATVREEIQIWMQKRKRFPFLSLPKDNSDEGVG